jgi:hypothetical protein
MAEGGQFNRVLQYMADPIILPRSAWENPFFLRIRSILSLKLIMISIESACKISAFTKLDE